MSGMDDQLRNGSFLLPFAAKALPFTPMAIPASSLVTRECCHRIKFAKQFCQCLLAVLISCGIATVFPSLVAARAAREKEIRVLCFTVVVIVQLLKVSEAISHSLLKGAA